MLPSRRSPPRILDIETPADRLRFELPRWVLATASVRTSSCSSSVFSAPVAFHFSLPGLVQAGGGRAGRREDEEGGCLGIGGSLLSVRKGLRGRINCLPN